MNWLDLLLGAILILSIANGIHRGFARIGIGLAATILAFVLASWFYRDAGAWAKPYVSVPSVANLVGYILVFFAVIFIGGLVGRLASNMFKWIGLSWFDRLMGGAVGVVRGALIAVVVLLMVSAFLPGDPPKAIIESEIAPYLLESAEVMSSMTPAELKGQFRQTYEKSKKAWVDPIRKQLPTTAN